MNVMKQEINMGTCHLITLTTLYSGLVLWKVVHLLSFDSILHIDELPKQQKTFVSHFFKHKWEVIIIIIIIIIIIVIIIIKYAAY